MGSSEQFNTTLDPPHSERVVRYAERNGYSKAEATRRLVQYGLAARSIAGKVAFGLAWLSLATFTVAIWFWGVYGGVTAPVAAATAPETAMALVLAVVYLVAAGGAAWYARRRSA